MAASKMKKFLAGAFMLAAAASPALALGDTVPAPATQQTEQISEARKKISQLVDRAVDTTDFFSRHKRFLEVVEVVKENPQLAAFALDHVATSFRYLPMDQWNLSITAIQNIATFQGRNPDLTKKAYEAVARPLTAAQAALRSGNIVMKTAAADVEVAIAMRMPGYSERIRADLIELMQDIDPRAQEAVGKALEYFTYAGRDSADAAALYEEPMRNYLVAIQQQYLAATPAQREEGRYTMSRQLELAAYSYGTVVSQHEATAEKGYRLFADMLSANVSTGEFDTTARAYHAIALNNLRKIGEARPNLSGMVLEQIDAHVRTAADPAYYDSLRAVEGIVQRQPEKAEQAAAILENMAVGGHYKYELSDIMDAIGRVDKKAGSGFLPETCEKLSAQLSGPKAKELAQALERSATYNERCASTLFATLKTLPASGAPLVSEDAGIALLGAIADKFPAQKPDAVSLLQAITLDALQTGKAETLARSGQELIRLNKPKAPKAAP